MFAGSGYRRGGNRGGGGAPASVGAQPSSSNGNHRGVFVDPAVIQAGNQTAPGPVSVVPLSAAVAAPTGGSGGHGAYGEGHNVMRFFSGNPQNAVQGGGSWRGTGQQFQPTSHHHHTANQHSVQAQPSSNWQNHGGSQPLQGTNVGGGGADRGRGGYGGRGGDFSGGRGGGGRGAFGSSNSEKKDYDAIVRAFVDSNTLTELEFPSTLSAHDRHHIHKLAMHFNLDHKSSGPASDRVLKLTKKARIVPPSIAAGEAAGGPSLSQAAAVYAATNATGQLLRRPKAASPRPAERIKTVDSYQGAQFLNDEWLVEHATEIKQQLQPVHQTAVKAIQAHMALHKPSRTFRAVQPGLKTVPPPPPSAVQQKEKLQEFRKKLPTMQRAQEIVHAVRSNRVTVVCGDTGCGKTTQIPQLLLDAGLLRREDEQIICTQPRRISALSVAQRVASERGQACGDEVGYIIRFENVTSRNTKVVYCTNGILLRRLHHDPELQQVRVVILDEVHERDADTDFSLLLLRELLLKHPDRDLRVVVMSATIQIDRLVSYFTEANHHKPPPLISIPGTLFRVDEYFLDDALQWLKLPSSAAPAMQLLERSAAMKQQAADAVADTSTAFDKLKQKALTEIDRELEAVVPYDIIVQLVEMYDTNQRNDTSGGILVFLPGWGPIDKVANMLRRTGKRFSVFMLHSSITAAEQQRAFFPPPRGFRKVVLATNVAETSITIDDITCVIDSGLSKGTAYDVAGNTSSLTCQLIAKANGIQRRGRAGRCRPGMCIHLLPRAAYQRLPDFLPPEIMRTSLEEICLQIKAIKPDEPCTKVLSLALDAPPAESIHYAVKFLKEIGALDPLERPTNLGRALATMPLHPSLGKMLLLAACCGVLEPVAIIAASLSAKSPFVKPMAHQARELQAIQQELDNGEKSDHLVALRIYKEWKQHGCQADFAMRHLCDQSALRAMERTTAQLMRLVVHSGFLKHVTPKDDQEYYASRYASNTGLIRLVLLWSLMPRIGTIERHRTRRQADFFCWDNKPASIHPSSLLNRCRLEQVQQREFIVYYDRMRIESQLHVFDASAVSRTAALLCARQVDAFQIVDLDVVHALEDTESKFGPLDRDFTTLEDTFDDLRRAQPLPSTRMLSPEGNEERQNMSCLIDTPGAAGEDGVVPQRRKPRLSSDYVAFVMDHGVKCFLVETTVATAIRMARETMDYFFSVSMKHVDISLFPDALVKTLALMIGYPVRSADPKTNFRPIVGKQQTAGDSEASLSEDLSGAELQKKKGAAAPKTLPGWMGATYSDDDADDKLLGSAEDDDDDGGVVMDAVEEIDPASLSDERLNAIYGAFGDLAIVRRALLSRDVIDLQARGPEPEKEASDDKRRITHQETTIGSSLASSTAPQHEVPPRANASNEDDDDDDDVIVFRPQPNELA